MDLIAIVDAVISWSFALLFFLVPLIFTSATSELFEFNKMMLTYALTTVIVSAWIIKMLLSGKIIYRRTFLEIPLILYLLSHIISTVISLDPHTSIWGYYSRFHEGLLASFSYLLLYFAAVSNLKAGMVKKIFALSFISGLIVALWGIGEHFGGSVSCLIFTNKFDDACWIQDVKDRVFATLGQPNWMAAYLDVLILMLVGIETGIRKQGEKIINRLNLVLIAMFFVALLFTKSRSGILGLIAGLGAFAVLFFAKNRRRIQIPLPLILASLSFVLASLIFGLPFSQIENLNLEHFLATRGKTVAVAPKPAQPSGYIDIGISESSDIRKIVWKGALKIWERYPIFGSGVETFAYAYYKDRPVEHNMVSEWDFLYNKAHNEYLNMLATTGTVGMVAYMLVILSFIFWIIFNFQFSILNKFSNFKLASRFFGAQTSNSGEPLNASLVLGLFAAYVSILVTNFFGFSVVIIGLYFFLIPAFSLALLRPLPESLSPTKTKPGPVEYGLILATGVVALMIFSRLLNIWNADSAYALGNNLEKAGQYVDAYRNVDQAVSLSPGEPLYRDELSYIEAALATAAAKEKSATLAGELTDQAIKNSDAAIGISPNNVTFWKTRTRVFYQLATIDPRYAAMAVSAIQTAVELAPTDARIHYNYGLILGSTKQYAAAVKVLEETVAMKPDYRDAHYLLGTYYKEVGKTDLARQQMEFILQKIGPDPEAQKFLEENK